MTIITPIPESYIVTHELLSIYIKLNHTHPLTYISGPNSFSGLVTPVK